MSAAPWCLGSANVSSVLAPTQILLWCLAAVGHFLLLFLLGILCPFYPLVVFNRLLCDSQFVTAARLAVSVSVSLPLSLFPHFLKYHIFFYFFFAYTNKKIFNKFLLSVLFAGNSKFFFSIFKFFLLLCELNIHPGHAQQKVSEVSNGT